VSNPTATVDHAAGSVIGEGGAASKPAQELRDRVPKLSHVVDQLDQHRLQLVPASLR
jgi:hypothetical protein